MKKIVLVVPIILCLLISCGGSSTSDQAKSQEPQSVEEVETDEEAEDADDEDDEDDDEDDEEQEDSAGETLKKGKSSAATAQGSDDFRIDDDMNARIEKTRSQHLGYVFIGSKKELKKLHLLTRKTIFSKRKLSTVNANMSNFQRIKTNTFSTIRIPGKNAKVLSDMPKNSYTITPSGNDCVLTVTDRMAFWQNCNYLVIQSKKDAHKGEYWADSKKKKNKKDYDKLKKTAGTVAETAGVVALSLVEGYVTQNILVEVATQIIGTTEIGRTALDVVEKTTKGKKTIETITDAISDGKSKLAKTRAKLNDVKSRKSTLEKELKKKGLSFNSDMQALKKSLSKEQFKELKSIMKDESKLTEKLHKLESKR